MDYRNLMQQRLDGEIDRDGQEELRQHLAKDQDAAEENAKLESVHDVLKKAPHVRAPQRLAATIMARLAQTIEAQAQIKPLPLEIRMALMASTSLITLNMMPTMLAASYMVVNLGYNPKVLSKVIYRTIFLQTMMIKSLVIMLEEIERMIEKDPKAAPVAMRLLPVALIGMLDYVRDDVVEVEEADIIE